MSIAQRDGPVLLDVVERTHLNRESCLLFILTQYAALTLIIHQTIATSQIATVEPYTPVLLKRQRHIQDTSIVSKVKNKISSLKIGLTISCWKKQQRGIPSK